MLARLAGFSAGAALALGAVCLARHVPTVLYVRTRVRAQKATAVSPAPAVLTAALAFFSTYMLARAGWVPVASVVLTGEIETKDRRLSVLTYAADHVFELEP